MCDHHPDFSHHRLVAFSEPYVSRITQSVFFVSGFFCSTLWWQDSSVSLLEAVVDLIRLMHRFSLYKFTTVCVSILLMVDIGIVSRSGLWRFLCMSLGAQVCTLLLSIRSVELLPCLEHAYVQFQQQCPKTLFHSYCSNSHPTTVLHTLVDTRYCQSAEF